MAIFGWKKSNDDSPDSSAGSGGGGGGGPDANSSSGGAFEFSPQKAEKFFARAVTVHETSQYEFAMTMWLSGLRQNPASIDGLAGFFKSSAAFMNTGVKGPDKSTIKMFSGRTEVDKYLLNLLLWSANPTDSSYAMKAVETADKLGLAEVAVWLGERAARVVIQDKKPRKDYLVKLMELFAKHEKAELAGIAGEAAIRIDPADAELAARVKNLAAESTMRKGGFENVDQEGGFRANIRDAAKQRRLEEGERLVATGEVLDRQVADARLSYSENPTDKPAIVRYLDALTRRGAPEDDETILTVANKAYEASKEFRFRETADKVRVSRLRRAFAKAKAKAEEPGATDADRDAAKSAQREWIKGQILAQQAAVAAYPTDLGRKFELGKLLYAVNRMEDAIALFQEAQADPRSRAEVLRYLGLAFQKLGGFHDEAIGTLRQALAMHPDHDDQTGMSLRYAMMEALFARAREHNALQDAEEAYTIASAITIKQINYADVRNVREQIKQFIAKIKSGTST